MNYVKVTIMIRLIILMSFLVNHQIFFAFYAIDIFIYEKISKYTKTCSVVVHVVVQPVIF